MPRVCTVCKHKRREEIEKALVVSHDSFRDLARRFRVSEDALFRHKHDHLPEALAKAHAEGEAQQARNVMDELERCLERVNLLFDACDEYLRDPKDPRRYTMGPRAEDFLVVYELPAAKGKKPVRAKKRLSDLLRKAKKNLPRDTKLLAVEARYADPRDLVLRTAARLQGHLELLAELQGKLSRTPTMNVLISPEWLALRSIILRQLAQYPEARDAVVKGLTDGVLSGA